MKSSQAEIQLNYRNMTSKQKKKRIEEASQQPENARPNPQAGHHFPEEQFIDMRVGDKESVKLATYRYVSAEQPIGVIHIFNGLYYHTNHSAHVAKAFAEQGYVVVGFDYRGYGKS